MRCERCGSEMNSEGKCPVCDASGASENKVRVLTPDEKINYDGVNKNRCEIKDGAFIGCNTNLVAPVTIGKNAYTGAGSTITKGVPDYALGIERGKQVNIAEFSKSKLAGRKLKVQD